MTILFVQCTIITKFPITLTTSRQKWQKDEFHKLYVNGKNTR